MLKFHGLSLAVLIALASSGCATLAPAAPEPETGIPAQWPMPAHGASDAPANDMAAVGWRDVLIDPRLERVVDLALAHNRDLRVAVLNVEKAAAQYRISRSDRIPKLAGDISMSRSRTEAGVTENYSVALGLASFELDLFGRVRHLGQAALESYFAQEESRRAAQISLIAAVTHAWMTLAADQSLLAIAEETLKTYEETLRLTEGRHTLGAASGLELAQMRAQVEGARADVARYAGQVVQDRNLLELLAGTDVPQADLPQGFDDDLVAMPPLPAGVPSQVLLRRPDIQAAEHGLLAASANIGAARAAFFPSISLTGNLGTASTEFSNLFESGTRFWSFVPRITIPIFQAGALKANLKVAEANRDIALASYEKAIQTGFREVADALSQTRALAEQRNAVEALLSAAREAENLSQARYDAGRDSYLTLLDAQRTRYGAQQNLISIRLAEQINRITLYSALGGGWSAEAPAGSAP